ncbi:MAG: hypothetical protein DCC67_11555 [Planctomycetota bacterium]|nr:MAG: hypothetical protein DCC67_11555 [Planctomycetota bacterium]
MQRTIRGIERRGALSLALVATLAGGAAGQTGYFGVAKVSINPQTPVMLSGYAGRSGGPEATVVRQNIVAQAAAFGDGGATALLLTVDCTGVPDDVVDPLRASLAADLSIPQSRIVVTSTHSHNCPHVDGYLPNLFSPPLTATQQQHVEQYTAYLSNQLAAVAQQAIANRTPGHAISWGTGSVGFAVNRRGSSEVDHDLPVMLVRDSLGAAKAIITSYATHAVTIGGADSNAVSGDWPGYARERIEALYPGAAALVMIGAGGDSNPSPQGSSATALAHGQAIANEVQRLVAGNLLTPVSPSIAAFHNEIELDYATSRLPGDPASARLAPSPASAMYGVTSWTFGDDLAMVFLEGEVVVDYSLRLKQEIGDRLWVNAYSNDVQGYIGSERILYEGGYEADDSSYYYGLPGRWAHGLEDKIVGAIHNQLEDFTGVSDLLRLAVDPATGETSIANRSDQVVVLDAYTIVSPAGRLLTSDGRWASLQDQGLAGWDEADNASTSRLTEFNPSGSLSLPPGGRRTLGTPYNPQPPAALGEAYPAAELAFEYSVPGVGVLAGVVEGAPGGPDAPHNNLVLSINPATGDAAIQNESPFFDASITAYTITSASGKLMPGGSGWRSLQDQGLPGWDEADNASPGRLTEFKTSGATLLDRGGVLLDLGTPVDISAGSLALDDFHFEFLLTSGEVLAGVVEFGPLPGQLGAGDYDNDADVDGADFLLWQRTFGAAADPAGSGADGSGNGFINAADLAVWRANFGAVAAGGALTAVPEPASLAAALVALAAGARGLFACGRGGRMT